MTMLLLSLAGVIIAIIVGSLWYSNATPMGKIHMRYLGFDKLSKEEQMHKMKAAQPMMWKVYTAQMGLALLTSFAVVFIITESKQNGLPFPMALGFIMVNWLCFMVPTIGQQILWSNCDQKLAWKKFFSDILCNLVTVVLIAVMTNFFV